MGSSDISRISNLTIPPPTLNSVIVLTVYNSPAAAVVVMMASSTSPGDPGTGLIYLGNELNADRSRCHTPSPLPTIVIWIRFRALGLNLIVFHCSTCVCISNDTLATLILKRFVRGKGEGGNENVYRC